MDRTQLIATIREKQSYLCIGLDSDIQKLPRHLLTAQDPQFEFNRQIIDATAGHCVAYKINTAFYESRGIAGWESLQRTISYIPSSHFTIADAKRGDIGNTSAQYATAFFDQLGFDAVTVAPYMGEDSVAPFLAHKGKWTILLGLTSNPGAADFEMLRTGESYLYEQVLHTACQWGSPSNLMFVIGATRPEYLKRIREKYPDHFFLVPGVGSQGGSLADISAAGLTPEAGLLVNVSRAVIFADGTEQFAAAAERVSTQYREEMKRYLSA